MSRERFYVYVGAPDFVFRYHNELDDYDYRIATVDEIIRFHESEAAFYAKINPNATCNYITQRLCYHRQQINTLQAFSGQAGKKIRR